MHQNTHNYCLEHNVRNLCDLSGGKIKYIPSRGFREITREFFESHVPIIPIAPFPIFRQNNISPSDSDVLTVATAVFYGAEELIIVKDTDGVYRRDTLYGLGGKPAEWMEAQRSNERLENVFALDLLQGNVDKTGAYEGKGNHLIEDAAIRYWMERAPKLKAIYIVPIAPERFFVVDPSSFTFKNLKKRHVIYPKMKFHPLEHYLSEALQGRGYKINRRK